MITDALARDNGALDINTGSEQVPIWVPVGGINSWSPSPTLNRADTTKFSDQGHQSHLPASLGLSLTFGGFRQVDAANGQRDPGQAAVEELSQKLGPNGLAQFRHSRVGGKVTTFWASAAVTDGGGGNDDPDAWSVELQRSGTPTTSTPADLPTVVTAVTGTAGTEEAEITWTDGAKVGSLFEIVIEDETGIVKQVIASEQPVLVQLEAGDYVARVRAQSNAGWNALSAPSSEFSVTS